MTVLRFFRFPLLAPVLLGGLSIGSAQTPNWSEITFSLTAQWISPQRDFGTYWKSGPALGGYANIPLNDPLSITALGLVSWHSPAETPRRARIPQVLLFQLGGGLSLSQSLYENINTSITVLLMNNAFIMTGPPVRPGFENAVESEFGISFEWALTVKPKSIPPISFQASYQPIFVGLDPAAIVSLGFVVGLG